MTERNKKENKSIERDKKASAILAKRQNFLE